MSSTKTDLIIRAEMDLEDGGAILNIGDGVLRHLNEALSAIKQWKEQTWIKKN